MIRRPLLAFTAAAALLVNVRAAQAQLLGPFIGGIISRTTPTPLPSNGFQVGENTILHAGVAVEAGYDSNVFYNDQNRAGAGLLRVTPFLQLTNIGRGGEVPTGLFYDLSAALTYREYLSDQADISRLRAFVPTIRGSIAHNSTGTLSASATEAFTRAEDAPYFRGAGQSLIIRNNNVASAQLNWAPGGGRLQGILRYTNTIDIFETEYLKRANSIGHEAMLDVSWRWLPKTALYMQLRQGYISYINNQTVSVLGDKASSFPLRAVVGIRGLITEKTSIALGLGYQNAFYSSGATTGGFLGSTSAAAELVVLPMLFTRIALGIRHDFQNSVIGNFYYNDGVYASITQQTVARVVGSLWGSYDYRRYYGVPGTSEPRRDNLIQAGAVLDYFVKTWAYTGVAYTLASNDSDYQPTGFTVAGASYTKHQIFARVGITY